MFSSFSAGLLGFLDFVKKKCLGYKIITVCNQIWFHAPFSMPHFPSPILFACRARRSACRSATGRRRSARGWWAAGARGRGSARGPRADFLGRRGGWSRRVEWVSNLVATVRVILCCSVSFHVSSCHSMSCHVMSYVICHIMLYRTVSYHVVSYHII